MTSDVKLQITHLFGIADCHFPPFRTCSHKSAVSKSMCMIPHVGGSYGTLCQELLGAGQVALRPRFEYGLANVHQGQLRRRMRFDDIDELIAYIHCQVRDRKDVA